MPTAKGRPNREAWRPMVCRYLLKVIGPPHEAEAHSEFGGDAASVVPDSDGLYPVRPTPNRKPKEG